MKYRVKCFDGGIWDEQDDRIVEAKRPVDAAEQVVGFGTLLDAGKAGQLRAQVSSFDDPGRKWLFYRP